MPRKAHGAELFAACCALTFPVWAGDLDEPLRARLARLGPNEKTTVFVLMRDQVDVARLSSRLDAMNATRAFRHAAVVGALQNMAARSQQRLLAQLDRLQDAGQVEDVTRFWVFNGVAMRATAAALQQTAAEAEVGLVVDAGGDTLLAPLAELVAPVSSIPARERPGPAPGLLECGADYVWAKGYTGRSVLVANLDTGVDGTHPALALRWRGAQPGVSAGAAWFDPTGQTTSPVDPGAHGTGTLSVVCGDDGITGEVGMAPGAAWIASNPVYAPGTQAQKNIYHNQAIQWLADPDGDPATVDDVPHVCNNSWGFQNGPGVCSSVFDQAIDAAEAAGVTLVWCAGNESYWGPRLPGARTTTDTNGFSVGALDPGAMTVATFSSRGPSPCDGISVKPEISAPGVDVRSAYPGGIYYDQSGTSFACPHVAGGAALLFDVWPEAPVDAIKRLLMQSATDIEAPGEDNDSGYGALDMRRAYDQLVAQRPLVNLSIMGSRTVVAEGSMLPVAVAARSYATTGIVAGIAIELEIGGVATGVYLIEPTPLVFPAGYSNHDNPAWLVYQVPTGLPDELIGVPISLHGVVWDQELAMMSEARYTFTLSR